MDFFSDNVGWFIAIGIPASAPLVTQAVNRFGSPKAKLVWNAVRRIYRRGILKEKP